MVASWLRVVHCDHSYERLSRAQCSQKAQDMGEQVFKGQAFAEGVLGQVFGSLFSSTCRDELRRAARLAA